MKKSIDLPKGILASDCKRPSYDAKGANAQVSFDYSKPTEAQTREFEIWYVERFGWVIPTLSISRARYDGGTRRTYAVAIEEKWDGSHAQVRVGRGPHVLRTETVYVRVGRKAALAPFLAIRDEGSADSNTIRDRISSRRAEGALRRARGERSWRWTV